MDFTLIASQTKKENKHIPILWLGNQDTQQLEQLSEIRLEFKILHATHLCWLVLLLLLAQGWLLLADDSTSTHVPAQQTCEDMNVPLLMHLWLLWFCYGSAL